MVHMTFVPRKHQKINEGKFDLFEIDYCGLAARGTRMAKKPVARMKTERRESRER